MARRAAFLRALLTLMGMVGLVSPARGEGNADLTRARELDQHGARAFRDGRYRDAIRFFREAHKLGAPSVELWNIAKCEEKLDEPGEADAALETYLAESDLTPGERADATKELLELRRRPSELSIDSRPSGAMVSIDGKRLPTNATTPLTVELAAGKHRVRVEKEGTVAFESDAVAKYGRAILIDARLDGSSSPRAEGDEEGPRRRFEVGALGGFFAPRLGGYNDALRPAAHLFARYMVRGDDRARGWTLSLGARFFFTDQAWSSSVPVASTPAGCTSPLPNEFLATELGAALTGGLAVRLSEGVRLGGDVGVGVSALFADRVGGDLFEASCSPAFGAKPMFHAGTELAVRVAPALHFLLSPVLLELHPAFDGARSAPSRASGVWVHLGSAIGVAAFF